MFGEIHLNHTFILVVTFSRAYTPILFEVHLVVFCHCWDLLSLSPGYDRVSPVSDPEPALPNIVTSFVFVRLQSPAEP